jgi:hypothetical protein
MACSPARENLGKSGSCLKDEELKLVAGKLHLRETQNRKKLVKVLKEYNVSHGCTNEACVIRKDPELNAKLGKAFRPAMPKSWKTNKREWLNTDDIKRVMTQYQEKYPHFKFLDVFSSDFKTQGVCNIYKMCDFHVKNLIENGFSEFALVLNLDKMNQPGSHWVSIFCSLDPNSPQYGISFYNSGGVRPIANIAKFMKSVVDQINEYGPHKKHAKHFRARYNKDRHQFAGSECGIFSIRYIELCLENPDKPYSYIRGLIGDVVDMNDDNIFNLRKKYFAA